MEHYIKQYLIPDNFINDLFTITNENYIDNENSNNIIEVYYNLHQLFFDIIDYDIF